LQETKCTDAQFPELALRAAGYHSAFHGQKSYNGVAILAKTALLDVRASLCDEEEDPQARVIAATIGLARVYSIYAPNGQAVGSPAHNYKLRWYERLRKCLLGNEGVEQHLAVCGDFNVAPKDEDVYDPDLWRGAIMCSDGERAAFEELCGAGMTDTLRIHHPEPGLFSWWDYRMLAFPKNRGLRIDAILASKSLAERCTAAGIEREMRKGKEPSDHAPVWAEFDL
jgi:exodeoxyribonuclease-3